MNCLEFRRLTLSDPLNKDPDYRQHRQQCAQCAAYAERSADFDSRLLDAASVPVPSDLLASVRLDQAIAEEGGAPQQGKRRCIPLQPMAIAASLMVAVLAAWLTLGPWPGQSDSPQLSLSQAVVAHVRAEPDHQNPTGTVPPGRAKLLLKHLGAELKGELGEVLYAGSCEIRNRPGAHMVLAGQRGPVTVLYIPDEAPQSTAEYQDGDFIARLHPAGRGSVAIIGSPGEALQPIIARLDSAVRWN